MCKNSTYWPLSSWWQSPSPFILDVMSQVCFPYTIQRYMLSQIGKRLFIYIQDTLKICQETKQTCLLTKWKWKIWSVQCLLLEKLIAIIRDTQHYLYSKELFRNCILYYNFFLQYLVLSWGHMSRSFLISVTTVIQKDSITIFRVLTSHLFHSSTVWEQIFLSNASLLRSLPAFCECAVAVDLFGSCLQRQKIHTSKCP